MYGGAGKVLVNYAKYYNKEEFDVKFVVPKKSKLIPLLKKQKAKIIEIDGIYDNSKDFKAIPKLIKIFKEEKPDIVHTHATFVARIAAKYCGAKIIYTRHSVFDVNPKIKKGIGKFAYKSVNKFFSTHIIAVAEAAKKNLTDGGIDPKKITVILNGVEKLEKYTPYKKNKAKLSFGLEEDNFVIGLIARIEEIKGQQYLIQTAKEVLSKTDKKIKFVIAGTGSNEENIKKLIKDENLEDSVKFLGFVYDVEKLMNCLNLQVNCSYGTEATSISLLEGMSIGIPAIVTNYGGNPGVIEDSVNGIVVPIKKPLIMAEKILDLIQYPTKWEYLSSQAARVYNEKFTGEVFAKNIENVYRKVMKKG